MARPDGDPRRALDGEEEACLRLLETLADTDPVPDTSAICLDRKRLLALLAEISKGERSEFLRRIAEVAERRGIAPQEIASRAGFLLACLDAPGSDDYYQILGVLPTATRQEIREAWIGRVSVYHPDHHPEKADWFTHQVARLNEAYHTLKDPERRREYDERRRREVLARQRPGTKVPWLTPWWSRTTALSGGQLRRRLPAILTGASVIAAGLLVVSLFLTRGDYAPEATFLSLGNISGSPEVAPSKVRPSPDDRQAGRSINSRAGIEKARGEPSSEGPAPSVQRDLRKVRGPALQRAIVTQALPPVVAEPKGLDRKEIDALLDEYVDAYEKGDVERLLATLSPKVREKESLDYQSIRSLYAKGFAGREQIIYRMKNGNVEIKGETATVVADYLISAKNAGQSQRGVTASGRIEWRIQREGGKAKIIAINY